MSRTERELVRARSDATQARSRLTGTLIGLQQRLKPSALLEEAVEELREKAEALAKEGIETIKARPVATAGAVAAVLVYLFRGPLWDAIVAAFSGTKATDAAAEEFQPSKRRAPRARRNGG